MPVQVPFVPVSAEPTTALPVIVGRAVFGGPTGAATTVVVAFDATVVVSVPDVATTRNRSRKPTSAAETTYASVETPNGAQSLPSDAPPDSGQRTH